MTMPMRDVTPIPKVKKARRKVNGRKVTEKEFLKEQATILHSMVVRARAGYRCERCGKTSGQMQCAHIFSRRYTMTRTDEANAWCLCATCHRYLTENPLEHIEYAYATIGQARFLMLRDKAYAGIGNKSTVEFWQGEVGRLEVALKAYGA